MRRPGAETWVRTVPPLWGKGRVEGARAVRDEGTLMDAGAKIALFAHLSGYTPIPPSASRGKALVARPPQPPCPTATARA